jgi:protein-L-isoaspartate(D-aspartate) O-methyltransferase
MVDDQIVQRGIHDDLVIRAMSIVPREEFVPEELKEQSYDDGPLPTRFGQTISQPYTVAYMIQELSVGPNDVVLDVGTGSGYAAAVLSRIVRSVYSIERFSELAIRARDTLMRLGYDNVFVSIGDGSMGDKAHSPFDAIIVAAASATLPDAYAGQLNEGGRIVIPIGDQRHQSLKRFTLNRGQLMAEDLGSFVFVPLVRDAPLPHQRR